MSHFVDLGREADRHLRRLGLRLTQGGEPTFLPPQASQPEWTFAALGPEKLAYARRLAALLCREWLPGAVPLLSLGKLYPGEPLPRWKLALHGAPGQAPFWRQPGLVRLEAPGADPPDRKQARQLVEALMAHLNLAAHPLAAYENVLEIMRRESSLGIPTPLPRFSRRQQRFIVEHDWPAEQQARWKDLCQPSGWVLPLHHDGERWQSPAWEWTGDPELVLLTGQSPIGLRLPLDQLLGSAPKCALTVEVRQEELCLFLPPVDTLDAWRELLAAIEAVLAQGDYPPLTLEGYPPPPHPDLRTLSFTADPGVLEVNLPPCEQFEELANLLRMIYQACERCGLRGYRQRPSGQRQGSGGGAHVILGGPDPGRNLFVQRPHLLASLLRFIQNHPSLSYLFSGSFIGPSSQATRADESLPGILPELEVALAALERMPTPGDAEMIDRILRNLLHDWHGNPHRAEVCIDKFFYPFTPDGRLGLVEFRAVEMMPAAEMLIGVHALFRGMAVAFAERPYRGVLREWGTALHDQFMLPWFLRQDLATALAELRDRGFPFAIDGFDPHIDFRFPILLEEEIGPVQLQIRQALEPWPVMGSQPGPAGTTSRPVDSSTDRLQLLLRGGEDAPMPAVLVNGIRLPFHRVGERPPLAVAGLRYRVFRNALGLQPHVPPHVPLVFEVVHPEERHVLARFRYRGPQAVETSPIRREPTHQGLAAVKRWKPNLQDGVTLDLRREG